MNVFLIGGKDLEMEEIKKLLTKNNCTYFDKNLVWNNAKLSNYIKELDKYGNKENHKIYGIELQEDIAVPANYTRIDHHNEWEKLPASIEQVAKLIGLEPDRNMQLVAANDKAYIPGMIAIGATNSEIADIRLKDRQAQGVTHEDECFAEEAIKNKQQVGDLVSVYSQSSRFSPICDKLFPCNKLLIYTDTELVYYGKGKNKLVQLFAKEIEAGKMYHGGGDEGFIGVALGKCEKEELEILKKMIMKEPYSFHTFMLPFKWENKESMPIDTMAEVLSNNDNNGRKWQTKTTEIDNNEMYSNFAYYHPFVQELLFKKDEEKHIYLEYEINQNESFQFETKQRDNPNKTFELKIYKIDLHLFFTGIGILTFQVENYQSDDLGHIKEINDCFRRIYPQFMDAQTGIEATKKTFLPDVVRASYSPIDDDFSYYSNLKNIKNKPIVLPNYIKILFGSLCDDITVVNDDRMYTMCWLGNTAQSRKICKKSKVTGKYFYERSSDWYTMTFCDKTWCTCQNDVMLQEHLNTHTYARWINYNTLYGITRDSFFMLTGDWNTLRENEADGIPYHLRLMYCQMAVLCLAQRASINKFAQEFAKICMKSPKDDKMVEEATLLHHEFIKFSNVMYFKEVTAQIQGVELYDMMQKTMNIDAEANRLDREIEELHSLIEVEYDRKEMKSNSELTKIATKFAPASVILAFLALFIDDLELCKSFNLNRFAAIVLTIVLGGLLYIIFIKCFIKKRNDKNK